VTRHPDRPGPCTRKPDAGRDPGGPVVQAVGVSHSYHLDGLEVLALQHADLTVPAGQSVALLGASGSGKSTLLGLVGGLQRVEQGSLTVLGMDMTTVPERELLAARATRMGVLFQNPGRNLLGYATASENLLFAQQTQSTGRAARRARTEELLDQVGLTGRGRAVAGAMSGGEQQRLSLAVALVNRPRLLLADEPTSQLDHASGERVVELLADAANDGVTVLVVTHDRAVAERMSRTVTMRDGRIISDTEPGPGDPR